LIAPLENSNAVGNAYFDPIIFCHYDFIIIDWLAIFRPRIFFDAAIFKTRLVFRSELILFDNFHSQS